MRLNYGIGFILSLLILLTIGCQQLQNQIKVEPDDATTSVSADDVKPDETPYSGTVFIGDAGDKFGTDEYTLNTAVIEGDTLQLNVSYSGGCETHQFTLVTAGIFLESFPVQLNVSVVHNANGDSCEAWLTEDFHFDLTPIKTLYQKAYRQEAGTIILRLKDAPNVELVYEFTM